MSPHCSPTFLLMKQLRSSQITSLPTACILNALHAHSLLNFYDLFLLKTVTSPLKVGFINILIAWLWVVDFLGPLFANIFMSFHEKSWFYNCPSLFKPLLYRLYVDDCFLLFRFLDHVALFLNCRNR